MSRRNAPAVSSFAFGLAWLACAPIVIAPADCEPISDRIQLPSRLDETSGVAFGRFNPSFLWTHNDDGSRLFAIERSGSIVTSTRVRPRLRDWEDIATGECEAHGACLYFADTGDNAERRPAGNARIVRLAEPTLEPTPGEPSSAGAASALQLPDEVRGEVFPIRLPDGARDVEALFVLPGERIHLVTKGRNHAITVYRYPPPLRPDTVTLEEVQRLTDGAAPLGNQVTGADAAAERNLVAVRTYQALELFRVEADTLTRTEDGLVPLRTLREAQGEAVGLGPDGLVALTSEGGVFGGEPSMNLLRCQA